MPNRKSMLNKRSDHVWNKIEQRERYIPESESKTQMKGKSVDQTPHCPNPKKNSCSSIAMVSSVLEKAKGAREKVKKRCEKK